MALQIVVMMFLLAATGSSESVVDPIQNIDPCSTSNYMYKPSKELPHGRYSFPPDFIFGTATSSFQIEGAPNFAYGKGPSVWDKFTHQYPDRILEGGNGDIAIDHYHKFKEDIMRMKYMNVDAYRFSISWPRIIPSGKRYDGVNQEGIKFYHDLLDELIKNGIEPFVTIWHWDTPQALEDEYGGFLSRDIIKDFEDYCDVLFQEYGSKVKKWITLNEPMGNAMKAYDEGVFAPGHCSVWVDKACKLGDSATEPYIVSHHQLLAHSAAYHLYKNKYRNLTGEIGITYISHWFLRYATDHHGITTPDRDGVYIGPHLGSYWQYLYPDGLRELLEYTKEKYDDPVIYITENGLSEKDNATQTLAEALNDKMRIDFYNSHLTSLLQAINEKQVNVKGFFAWSFADNFEWNEGYTVRFGLYYVNYTDLSRHPKNSACWYTNFCNKTQSSTKSSFNKFDLDKLITTRIAPGGRRSALSRSIRLLL
ncbi:Cyanogenic beta-glucosidase (Fragment) [Linum grandiflorum]